MTNAESSSSLYLEDLSVVDRLCWHWHDSSRIDECMQFLAKRSADIAGAENAAVFLTDETTGKLKLRAVAGAMEADKELLKGYVKQVIASKEAHAVVDGTLVLTLAADGAVQGAIVVPLTGKVSEESIKSLALLAERAALAISRAQQCQEVIKRLNIIESLLEISEAAIEDAGLSRAFRMVAERAASAVRAELTAVGLIDWNTKELHYIESFGELADRITGSRTPITEGLRRLVSKSGEPVIINDVASDGRIPEAVINKWGIRSLLIVPLRIRKKVTGVLLAANRHGGPFAIRDLRLFEAIAHHGSAAIAHAELHFSAQKTITELDSEKSKIEAVLAQLGDGVVVCDADSVIIMMNEAAEKIVGLPTSAVIGKKIFDMHPPHHRQEVEHIINQFEKSKPESGLFWEQNITLPGRKIVRINMRPVFNRSGQFTGTATVMHDVTAQVELDEIKAEFISVVAHELRTPLSALKGSLGLILGGAVGNVNPNLYELMKIAQNNCNRLIRLVDDRLDVAKIEAGYLRLEMDIISVQDRVMNAIRQMQHIADDYQIEIRTKVSGKPQPNIGDGDRIEQVMTNLLSNAIKFSPPGSAIDVTVRQLRGLIKVSVADQGPGIAPGEREMVFEKFYQGSIQSFSKEVGSGLGLAISKAIVEQHGGSIIVDSNSGKGSVFSFLLPVPAEDTKGAGSLSNKDQHTAQDGA